MWLQHEPRVPECLVAAVVADHRPREGSINVRGVELHGVGQLGVAQGGKQHHARVDAGAGGAEVVPIVPQHKGGRSKGGEVVDVAKGHDIAVEKEYALAQPRRQV
eukprot:6256521-Prymnesium_polylepis.2